MSEERERDEATGTDMTGHEWDGIRELDTPLPRWWLNIFYASIVAAIAFWVLMPAWPLINGYTHGLLHYSDRRNVAADLQQLERSRAPMYQRLAHASPGDLARDPQLQQFARAAGESAFAEHCVACHQAGGAGAPGYPNLADDVWLWGGTLDDIQHTIQVGIRSENAQTRSSQMPSFGRDALLTPQQIHDVTEHVISISGAASRLHPDMLAASRGAVIFHEQCAACHGASGQGDRTAGAPSLQDDVWLYGGTREEIRRQIELGRGGVMPTWDNRLDAGTIRALAFYVHELGGGEPDAPPVAAPTTTVPASGATTTATAHTAP